jgi:Tfp pilus assembly protein PilN
MPPFFTRNLCVALTWDNARRVYGVRLRRLGTAIRVETCWSLETGEPADLGSRLAAGRNALGADETTTVVAGPAGLVVGVADLAMPKLGVAELRQALAFELARRAPVPPERLAWGWRVLPPDAATASQRLRLGFLRETEWRRLLDDLAGMGAGVDLCLPPILALDPALAGQPVFFPSDPDQPTGAGFIFRTDATGNRITEAVAPAPETMFGAPTVSLATAGVELAPAVAALEPAVQARFAGALILGLHGLSGQVAADVRTWLPLPRELRIHRNRTGRVAAVGLAAYLALVTAVAVGRRVADNARQLSQIKSELAQVQQKIAGFKAQRQEQEFLDKLEGEFRDARLDRPGFTACLAELTRIIPKDAWSQSVTWTDGRVELELLTANDTINPLSLLETSPLLGNVEPVRKSLDANKQTSWRVRAEAMNKPASALPPPPATPAATAPATSPADGDGAAVRAPGRSPLPTMPPPPPPPTMPPTDGQPAADTDGTGENGP